MVKRVRVRRQKTRRQMKMSLAITTFTPSSTLPLNIVIKPPSEKNMTQKN